MKHTVKFQDASGKKLDIVLDTHPGGGYIVYALYDGERGASTRTFTDRAAKQAWSDLENKALSLGWKYKTYEGKQTQPGKMEITVTGARIFRDRRTGEPFVDESASRPPQMPSPLSFEERERLRRVTVREASGPVVPQRDAFTADTLPAPQ